MTLVIYIFSLLTAVMCIDMDNDYIVSGSSDETIRIWRVHTADCEHVFTDTDIKMGEVVRVSYLVPRIMSCSHSPYLSYS